MTESRSGRSWRGWAVFVGDSCCGAVLRCEVPWQLRALPEAAGRVGRVGRRARRQPARLTTVGEPPTAPHTIQSPTRDTLGTRLEAGLGWGSGSGVRRREGYISWAWCEWAVFGVRLGSSVRRSRAVCRGR